MVHEPATDAATLHVPVLADEVLAWLAPRDAGLYLDATLGLGGHAERILAASSPGGRLLGIDRDPRARTLAGERLRRFGDRARIVAGDFGEAASLADAVGLGPFDGVLADLGVSSLQLDDSTRGFSFSQEGPLDMRMDPALPETAGELVNRLDAASLAAILRGFGEERLAGPIARRIVARREESPFTNTRELAELVRAAYRRAGVRSEIDPATRTFQALRIAVNGELESLDRLLASLARLLAPGGIACVLSFHSLEDRAVKHAFRDLARGCVCPPDLPVCACGRSASARVLTPRPIRPSEAEVAQNPRARSVRMRVLRWLGDATRGEA